MTLMEKMRYMPETGDILIFKDGLPKAQSLARSRSTYRRSAHSLSQTSYTCAGRSQKMYKILQIQPKSNMIVAHIKHNKRYYCVGDDGYSIQIFDSNKDGEIVSWIEIARLENRMLKDVVKDKSTFRTCLKLGQKMS